MAHRIYIYNVDLQHKVEFPVQLAEWSYVLPILFIPLFGVNIRAKGTLLYADKVAGVERLRAFYDVLETAALPDRQDFTVAKAKLFDFLENLPYDTFKIDGRDVFDMQDEKHSVQAKDWVFDIKEDMHSYDAAIAAQSLAPLTALLERSHYTCFSEILETDWIAYGLGYWEKAALQEKGVSQYEAHGLYGLKDRNDEVLLTASFTRIHPWNDAGIAVVEKEGRFGYVNNEGQALVSCSYAWAMEAHEVNGKNYAEVKNEDKWGILAIETATWTLPPKYDAVRWIHAGYFNVKEADVFHLYDERGNRISPEAVAWPFQYDFKDLFFVQAKGSISRKYYQRNGLVFGTFMEDVLQPLVHGYFWTKPNKLQKKITVLKPDGQALASDVDRIMVRDGYQTIAYLQGKAWEIYDLENHIFRLAEEVISKLSLDEMADYAPDVFVLTTAKGLGIYQALAGRWLLNAAADHQKITHCFMEFMRITTSHGMHYFDVKLEALSERYDYICEPIHYPNATWKEGELLILFKEDRLYKLDLQKQVVEIPASAIPNFYGAMQNLPIDDQQYFETFYQRLSIS